MTSTAAAISIARTTREIRLRMVWALSLTAASIITIRAANDTGVTAAQINGTWATPAGEFKIWAIDHHRSVSNSSSPLNIKEKLAGWPMPAMVTASRRSKVTSPVSRLTVRMPIAESL